MFCETIFFIVPAEEPDPLISMASKHLPMNQWIPDSPAGFRDDKYLNSVLQKLHWGREACVLQI
jgi:hypothetical protein